MVQRPSGELEMNDHVTNAVAVGGACAPLWAHVDAAVILQVVSIVWIVLQTTRFTISWWRGDKS